jgi:2',3'-cyclic-nucleotide 2'-phosphodiesterase (5'-nucleotidase family)
MPLPKMVSTVTLLLALAAAPQQACARQPSSTNAWPDPARGPITISILATTDLHGHVESLPWLSGHLANLRAGRLAQGGGVLLVDSGDMFQGTLESNLGEGAAVVRAYNALGYTAVTIGNHEFDFGPLGPAHVPARPGDDPRGALKARAAEARYPFLAANLRETGAGAGPVTWPNVRPWVVVPVAGTHIGFVGVTTIVTPRATHPYNFAGLTVKPLAPAITEAARAARQAGAVAVVVLAHAGGRCSRFEAPDDLASCDSSEEIFGVARELPPGLVDAIAAGHTHQGVAHRVAGIPVVQAHSGGRAFARLDLTIDVARRQVAEVRVFPPRWLCGVAGVPSFAPDACRLSSYEGRPVSFDARTAALLAPDIARAADLRRRPVGVRLRSPLRRGLREESPLGNFTADLLRAAHPGADVGFINGGSLRSDLPAGPLRYGDLYQSFPFDDGIAVVHLTAGKLAALLARNLGSDGGILSISGLRAAARCQGAALEVTLLDAQDRPLPPAKPLVAVTNGYLASGGDGLFEGIIAPQPPAEATPMRERFAAVLSARGGEIDGNDPGWFDLRRPRLQVDGRRPIRCPPLSTGRSSPLQPLPALAR